MRTKILAQVFFVTIMLAWSFATGGEAEKRSNDGGWLPPEWLGAWIFDSTLDLPFALVTPPPGYTVEGNVAWAWAPPVRMYSMWVRFVHPGKGVLVEIAVPVDVFTEPWNAVGPPLRHDAAGVLRTFVQPILAAVSPGAKIGEIRELTDSPLLVPARLDLAKSEEPFLAAGRTISEAKADAAEMTATSGTLQTRFSVAAWSFLYQRESSARFTSFGKWTGLLCVTAPTGENVSDAEVRALLDGIRINPEWRDQADRKLAELSAIEESPPFYLPEEKNRWRIMNRSGTVLIPPPGRPLPELPPDAYEPPHRSAVSMPSSSRYTYVNAAIDGCFLGFQATAKSADIENINPLVLFP